MVPCLTIAACAANAPYNPQHLSADQVDQVAEICETVMAFEPSAPLVDNLWPGDPDPESSTNDYRGCVASLSSSLRRVTPVSSPAAGYDMERREQLACAEIGLKPAQNAFASCVRGLNDVLSAKAMGAAYSNP
jgi:hypothetical protein